MIDGVNHPDLLAYAARLVGDEAEDVVQDAYVRMLTTRSPFSGASSKQTWACAIVKRLAASAHRRASRQPQTVQMDDVTVPTVEQPSLDAARTIERLDPEAQEFLAAWHGSVTATADALGLSRWKARQIVERIRKEIV